MISSYLSFTFSFEVDLDRAEETAKDLEPA